MSQQRHEARDAGSDAGEKQWWEVDRDETGCAAGTRVVAAQGTQNQASCVGSDRGSCLCLWKFSWKKKKQKHGRVRFLERVVREGVRVMLGGSVGLTGSPPRLHIRCPSRTAKWYTRPRERPGNTALPCAEEGSDDVSQL